MTQQSNNERLSAGIIPLSVAKTWDEAKLEWTLQWVWLSDKYMTCLCEHYPIVEICELRNSLNGAVTEVGNVCVNKFLRLESNQVFREIKRIAADATKPLGLLTIELLHRRKLITEWEIGFLVDTSTKRAISLSQRQLAKRIELNQRTLRSVRDYNPSLQIAEGER